MYAPKKGVERKDFLKKDLKDKLNGNYPVIMGGDLNCVLNKKDRRTFTNRKEEGQKELLETMKLYELEDIFRRRYPNKVGYTYFKRNTNIASRLDMWITSSSLDPIIKKIDSCVAPNTDHHALEMTIKTNIIEKGPGRWMLSSKIIS